MRRTGPVVRAAALAGFLAVVAGCGDDGGFDPCAYVTCSSRGFCESVGGEPVCRCIEGYHAVGLECVPDGAADADADAPDDAPGEADLGAGDIDAEAEVPVGSACASDWDCAAEQACRDGICQRAPCTTDADCNAGEQCVSGHCHSSTCRSHADCGAEEYCDRRGCIAGVEGYCRWIAGGTCAAVYDPVCGCNGTTYGNDCERVLADVALRSTGACP